MRTQRAGRWGLGWAGMLVAVALAPASPNPQQPADVTEAIRTRAEAKVRAATEVLAMCREFLVAPPGEKGTPAPFEVAETIQFWSRQLTDAQLETVTDHDERVKILTEAFDRAKGFDAEIKELAGNEASGLTKLSAAKAVFYAADAEVRLIREKAAPSK